MDNIWIAEETTPGTFVAPSGNAVSGLQSFNITTNDARIARRESGRSHGMSAHTQGSHMPSGAMTIIVEPDNVVELLRSLGFLTITSSTPDMGVYQHVLEMDDDGAPKTLSVQAQQRRVGTASALNVRGVAVSNATFDVSTDNFLSVTLDYLAYEATTAGVDFSNGNTSITALSIAHGTLMRAFQFDRMTITRGGTLSRDGTTRIITASGATAITNAESLSLSINYNKEQRLALGSRYPQQIITGNRDVTFTMSLRNDTPSTTLWASQVAGTQEALIVKFSGLTDELATGHTYELEFALPVVDYTGDDLFGELSSELGARSISLSGTALNDATLGDIVGRVKNGTASY